jgi:hypothetical protein
LPADYVKGKLRLHVVGDDRPLADISGIEPITNDPRTFDRIELSPFPPHKRLWLLPHINLLVTIPEPADRIVLQKVDAEAILAASSVNYLAVTSKPPEEVTKGQVFRYLLTSLSKAGGVTYELVSGHEGMQVSPDGELSWAVPVELAADHVDVMILVRDAGQQETFHKFRLALRNPPEGTPRPGRPAEPAYRLWVDISGRFRVKAQLLEADQDQVRLMKTNGVVIDVPINRLSPSDQEYLRTQPEKKR